MQLKSSPNLLQLGKAHARQQSPSEAIKKQFFFFKDEQNKNSLEIHWLWLDAFTAVAQVQSLVGELKSLKPYGTVKKIFK